MSNTWKRLMAIAERIERTHPVEAIQLNHAARHVCLLEELAELRAEVHGKVREPQSEEVSQ